MDINGESSSSWSSSSTSGFKLFGKTIVMSEKDAGSQDHAIIASAGEEEEEEEASISRSSKLEEETSSEIKTTTKVLACPRCRSKETKFCYFNNYNANQPRHFCKACHRYWTAGGALRNVPVGAGRRKNRAPLPHQGGGDGAGAEGGGTCLVGGRRDPDPGGWKCG